MKESIVRWRSDQVERSGNRGVLPLPLAGEGISAEGLPSGENPRPLRSSSVATSPASGRGKGGSERLSSLVQPCVLEAVVDADAGGDQVLDLAAHCGRELQLEHPGHRHVLDQDLLRLLVDL